MQKYNIIEILKPSNRNTKNLFYKKSIQQHNSQHNHYLNYQEINQPQQIRKITYIKIDLTLFPLK
jgi:hypothetical protein